MQIQVNACTAKGLECVHNIKIDSNICLPPCTGLILTSFSKTESKRDFEGLISEEVAAYNQYMKWSEFPSGLKGFKNEMIKTRSTRPIDAKL